MAMPSSNIRVDPYDRFLECNNRGLASLMNGNLPEAYRHLCAGFGIAKEEQVAALARSPVAAATNNDETSNGTLPEQPESHEAPPGPLAEWPWISREEVVTTLSNTMTFDLRMDGLSISADALIRRGERGSLGRDDWTLASAFAAYNIGVVYLIGGTQASIEAHHNKARIMFESCMGLILCSFRRDREDLNRESSAARKRLCPTGNPIVDVLSLLVLAKTSQAYHFMSRFDGARAYVVYLCEFIRLLREGRIYSEDDLIDGLIQRHCERFACELSSILILESLAPAA